MYIHNKSCTLLSSLPKELARNFHLNCPKNNLRIDPTWATVLKKKWQELEDRDIEGVNVSLLGGPCRGAGKGGNDDAQEEGLEQSQTFLWLVRHIEDLGSILDPNSHLQ